MSNVSKLRSLLLVLVAVFPALVVTASRAVALDVEVTTRPVLREILALYDSRHEKTPAVSRLHRLAEMPLNWLGYKLVYQDVNSPLPSGASLKKFRGAVTWFSEPLADPKSYLEWLDAATADGLRLACLAELAPPEPEAMKETVSRIFARLGLKFLDQFVRVTHTAKLIANDPGMVGFEQAVDRALPEFPVLEQLSASARVHLSASVPGIPEVSAAALVVTGPGGGYAADGFTIFYDQSSDKVRWVLNPFAFFKNAFGDERFPIPDVTTLNGRRIYFSHIDGDGWNNVSEIEGYRELQATASEAIRREAIEPYPDLPVSVGLIAGDADPSLGGLETTAESAAKIFALPQVEVASHTYTHPFAWGFFDRYDRNAELELIDKFSEPAKSVMERIRGVLYRVAGKSDLSDTRSKYVAGSSDLPRSYLKEPFDIEKEVKGALDASTSLAPPGKRAAIYLWSGDTEPGEALIKATRLAGVRNMNGGDTRFDAGYPSVFYVPPIARPVGAERQMYAANSNENTYTNNWTGPFYGQLLLEQTLQNTEQPRRLKPFNLYYHMYSGEKPAALKALKHLLELARKSPVIPVNAAQYAAIADDFFAVEMEQFAPGSWNIVNRGAVQTVRFDDAEKLDLDMPRSTGVLGASLTNGTLYVALDPAVDPAVVALKSQGGEQTGVAAGQIELVESRWHIKNKQKSEGCGFSADVTGFGPGEMIWRGRPGQEWEAVVERAGQVLVRSQSRAGTDGRIDFKLEADVKRPANLRLICRESAT